MIVVAWDASAEVTCGSTRVQPLAEVGEVTATGPQPGGTELGKRYVDDAKGVELLVVRPGAGSLRSDGQPMAIKVPKPLPTSD